MRDSVESTWRTLRPTAHRLKLKNLLEHFRHLNLSDNSDFFVPVETDWFDSPEDRPAVSPYLTLQRILDPDDVSSLFIRPDNHMDSSSSISTEHPRSSEEFDNPVTPNRQSRLPDYKSFSSPVVPGAFTHSSPRPV